ncbi:hypothetical protein LCGC14_0811060 [marine sediment metagenome]|uniref:Uncharacterized protein n=1 Tax=marine sediment metagenome TaxID=412755 RepID=A0A0F9PLS2_9ZZZZ
MEENTVEDVYDDCAFAKVSDDALKIARTLLLNLGERFLRGLKNQVTNAEHRAMLLAIETIEREIELRKREFNPHKHVVKKPAESGANGER